MKKKVIVEIDRRIKKETRLRSYIAQGPGLYGQENKMQG